MSSKILIVEDDTSFLIMLEKWCIKNNYDCSTATECSKAKSLLSSEEFSLILTDLRLPDGDGIDLLSWMREEKIDTPVILMTSYAEIQSAVASIKMGAYDFLEKPVSPTILKEKIESALSLCKSMSDVNSKVVLNNEVEGLSTIVRNMYKDIELVAPTNISVLITGESGTGKEHAARRVHESSKRSSSPFIAVDCGAIPKELAASELFGHIKGSFTGALENKVGVFEEANGGTIFFDEIGNLPYEVQIQLLRALQEKKVRAVGSNREMSVDIRVVSATNENLEEAIKRGEFREDLYHRINEFTITTPPLRDRGEDILLYAKFFIQQANIELERSIVGLSPQAESRILSYNWPGNLRELRNVIRRAALFATGGKIQDTHLSIENGDKTPEATYVAPLRNENEKELIEQALEKSGGNKSLAARLLKIDRKTLYNKLKLYSIE
ncbi:MAG: sigma-54-dependent transcriptional regulator [Bacteroidales bacterium]